MRYTRSAMQRGVAGALALLFSWLLIVPAFAVRTESVLPACCRKGGSHQCTMRSAQEPANSEPSLHSVEQGCPFAHHSSTAAAHGYACGPTTGESVYAGLIRHPAISPQTEANFRISYDRSRQKRGPPVLILS